MRDSPSLLPLPLLLGRSEFSLSWWGREWEGHWNGWALKSHNSKHAVQNTDYRTSEAKTHVHKITNVHAFYMTLEFHDFDGDKSISLAIGRGGP